jgi:MraZ protein
VNKARFREKSEHCLDDKGRLSLPSRFREQLRRYDSEILIVSIWGREHLRVFPLADWEEIENKLESDLEDMEERLPFLDDNDPEFAKMSRQLEQTRNRLIDIKECPLDKQGRILLSQQVREQVGILKDVVLVGRGKLFELWGKENWQEGRQRLAVIAGKHDDTRAALGVL